MAAMPRSAHWLARVSNRAARAAARRLAAPLEAMATAAERIADGDVQQEVTYRSSDEVGRLAEAFRGTIRYVQEVARGAEAVARGEAEIEEIEERIFAGETTRLAYGTDEAVEGRDSFLEKRDADWSPFPYYY